MAFVQKEMKAIKDQAAAREAGKLMAEVAARAALDDEAARKQAEADAKQMKKMVRLRPRNPTHARFPRIPYQFPTHHGFPHMPVFHTGHPSEVHACQKLMHPCTTQY